MIDQTSRAQSLLIESGAEGRKKGHRFGGVQRPTFQIARVIVVVEMSSAEVQLPFRSEAAAAPSFAGCSDELFLDFERELADLLGHPDG